MRKDMRYFYSFLGSTILISILTAVAAQQPSAEVGRKGMEAAFRGGKSVVLVIAPSGKQQSDDESYGDWADGLNDFATHVGADVKILKLTPLKFRQLLQQPKLKEGFATLFMRDSDHALVYDGMVTEPKVYEIGLAYLKHQPYEKSASAYLLQEKTAHFK
jgi:hypothetical protein